jgi:hypothetical protein
MTRAEAVEENGLVEITLDLVRKKKLVSFEYKGNKGRVPLLSIASPSGKFVTAVGISGGM